MDLPDYLVLEQNIPQKYTGYRVLAQNLPHVQLRSPILHLDPYNKQEGHRGQMKW